MQETLRQLAIWDSQGKTRPYPTINEVFEARAKLTTSKAPGPHDSLVAEMLRALSPTLVYIIAYHFAKRIRNPEHTTTLSWAKFAILF